MELKPFTFKMGSPHFMYYKFSRTSAKKEWVARNYNNCQEVSSLATINNWMQTPQKKNMPTCCYTPSSR